MIFNFKLFKLPDFFLDLDYTSSHVNNQIQKLVPYQPVAVKGRSSISKKKKSGLNQDALKKLNEANRDSQPSEQFGSTLNKPPSFQDGVVVGGNFASDSIGIDTLSQTDSVAKQRRPGSVVNFGGRGSSARRSRRGSVSQRSGSGS